MQVSSIRHSVVLPLFFLLLLHGIHAQFPKRNTTVPALIVFGDSIVDPGNNNVLKTVVRSDFPPYGRDFEQQRPTGRFCNGKIPGDMIAESLGIKDLLPAYFDTNLTAEDLLTGVSFASAGCGYDNLTSELVSVFSLSDQLEFFCEYKEKLKAIAGEERAASIVSDSIYIVSIGTDDIANTYYSTPFRKAHYDVPAYVELMVQSASSFYQELYKLGARKIGVVGLPPLGCLPAQRTVAGGKARNCSDKHNQAAIAVNNRLSQEIQRLQCQLADARIIYIDIYTVVNDIIRRPDAYGFEVSDKGCCGTGTIEVSVLCNPLSIGTCQNVSEYVFWDSYHPTEKAYSIIEKTVADTYLPLIL